MTCSERDLYIGGSKIEQPWGMACRGVACELLMLSLCIWCQQRRNCGSVQGNQEMNPRMEKRLLSWRRSKPDRTGRKMSQRHSTKVLFETGRRSHATILLTGHLLRNSSEITGLLCTKTRLGEVLVGVKLVDVVNHGDYWTHVTPNLVPWDRWKPTSPALK